MNTQTTNNRFEAKRDRRTRLRRASDREAHARLKDETGRCAEFGCDEHAWPDSEYCLWHPTLRLVEGGNH